MHWLRPRKFAGRCRCDMSTCSFKAAPRQPAPRRPTLIPTSEVRGIHSLGGLPWWARKVVIRQSKTPYRKGRGECLRVGLANQTFAEAKEGKIERALLSPNIANPALLPPSRSVSARPRSGPPGPTEANGIDCLRLSASSDSLFILVLGSWHLASPAKGARE